MLKNLILSIVCLTFSILLFANVKSSSQHLYTDCYKGDTRCIQAKEKGMAEDKRRYEAWCKQHPGQCSSKLKMF